MQIKTGQVVVITGAASGIGLALAQLCAKRGLRVAMADVEESPLAQQADLLAAAGAEVLALNCDVRNRDAVERVRDAVVARFGRVDIVCNNAGVVLPFGPLWQTDPRDWEWILDVNLRGVFNGIRTFVPLLVEQGSGHIVNTASMAGVAIVPGNGAYNATKHAVVSLTETLDADLRIADSPVGATVLCCGLVRTRILEARRDRPTAASAPVLVPNNALPAGGGRHLDPNLVAQLILEAIEQQRLYLFTNPGSEQRIRARIDRLLGDAVEDRIGQAR